MTMNRIPSETKPMITRMYPGGIHTGETEAELLRQTQALWFNNLGTRHSYYYDAVQYAPYVQVSATHGTWTKFSLQQSTYSISCEASIPWYIQTGSTKIRCRVIWTANSLQTTPVHIRASFQGLITSVTESFSTASVSHLAQADFNSPKGQWRTTQEKCMYADVIGTPEIPADRGIDIRFEATMYAEEGANPDAVGNYRPTVYIIGLLINDMFAGPTL